jgi:hypothetical protein
MSVHNDKFIYKLLIGAIAFIAIMMALTAVSYGDHHAALMVILGWALLIPSVFLAKILYGLFTGYDVEEEEPSAMEAVFSFELFPFFICLSWGILVMGSMLIIKILF